MKKFLLVAILILKFIALNAQELSFSDSTEISLITCSPGKEVYEKFGHTGIRVIDKKKNTDFIFNYGIFNFETNNFYYKFIKGETDYELGISYTGNFLASYAQRNSIVWEQILNLTNSEKTKLIGMLVENYKPENRTYRYNFVFDNCATRPRDKILSSLDGYVRFELTGDPNTFRQWIGNYVGTDTWLKFGIDLTFGMDADNTTTTFQSMFLPEVLMSEFQTAQINLPTGKVRNLVSDKKILVNKNAESESENFWLFKPFAISIILLIIGLIISIWDANRGHVLKLFDSIIYIFTGLGGIIVAYLMFFSVHPLVEKNLTLLWLNPLNLIAGIILWNRKLRLPMFVYQILNIFFLVLSLLAFALSIQSFNYAVFPIIVLLIIRSANWMVYLKKKNFKHKTRKFA
jgi:hypothetical protein